MFLFEIDAAAINDELRHLRRRGVVQIDERFAVDRLPEHGEIFTDALDIPNAFDVLFQQCFFD
jgi:hypothetical protein